MRSPPFTWALLEEWPGACSPKSLATQWPHTGHHVLDSGDTVACLPPRATVFGFHLFGQSPTRNLLSQALSDAPMKNSRQEQPCRLQKAPYYCYTAPPNTSAAGNYLSSWGLTSSVALSELWVSGSPKLRAGCLLISALESGSGL